MHFGAFDDEPATVEIMDTYLQENGYKNDLSRDRLHHEIYLSDARKVAPEKWKTVIRHPIALLDTKWLTGNFWCIKRTIFVGYVNENLAKAEKGEKNYETAIRDAVNRCIAEDILKDFLLERGEDVQKEGRAEGYSSGIAEGRAEGYRRLVNSIIKKLQKNKSLEQIADELEESVETIQPIYDIVKKHAPEYDADTITTEVLEARENEKV